MKNNQVEISLLAFLYKGLRLECKERKWGGVAQQAKLPELQTSSGKNSGSSV
jgi:hypothetical protein